MDSIVLWLLPIVILVISCCFESRDKFRYYLKFILYAVYSSIVAVFMLPYVSLRPGNVINARHASLFLRLYTKLLGIEWEFRGQEQVKKVQTCVVVVNHQSILDILGLFNIWWRMGDLAAVAKNALLYVFPFGPIAWLAGTVFIDRNNGRKSMKTLERIANKSKSQATKLLIFPEGTRNKDILLNGIQQFKKGAFKIAVDHHLPIIPLVVSPYYFIDEKTYFFGHGKVIIKALEPISTENLGNEEIDDLVTKTHEIMQNEFRLLAQEVASSIPKDYPGNVNWRKQLSDVTNNTAHQ